MNARMKKRNENIRKMRAEGKTLREIGKIVHRSHTMIRKICMNNDKA